MFYYVAYHLACSILLLQETWLVSNQFSMFSKYFPSFRSVDVFGMDESNFVTVRPYGGCYIFYSDRLHVTPIYFKDAKRMCGIEMHCNSYEYCIFNMYMPCDDGTESSNTLISTLLLDISI